MESFYTQIEDIVFESNIDSIIVLGKGSTAIGLPKILNPNVVVININDSERIYPGQFALIHRDWVIESLRKDSLFKARLYISNQEIYEVNHLQIPYFPLTEEGLESVISKLVTEGLFITDFLFLTAIKLSIILSEIKGKKELDVFFLGFDFNVKEGFEGDSQYNIDDLNFKDAFFQIQEHYFEQVLDFYHREVSNVNLKHVGDKRYSSLPVKEFQDSFNRDVIRYPSTYKRTLNSELYATLKKDAINGKTLIVAEFTNNHIGDPERLLKMIRLSKEAGADLIKVQKREVQSFYTAKQLSSPYQSPFGSTLGDYRSGIELSQEMFKILEEECERLEIPWFSTVLDYPSLNFINRFDCPLIKLPSTISNHKNFIKKVSDNFEGDVVVSTGFTDQLYENFVIDTFGNEGRTLWLLQCSSSYPTPPEACQISVVRHYDKIKEHVKGVLIPGYSSHDVGSLGCMLAVAAGAKMVEKHVKLGDLDWVHFDSVAINLYNNEFTSFIKDVRKAEVMSGREIKFIHPSEHHKYLTNSNHN